jgi:hypothetical protein
MIGGALQLEGFAYQVIDTEGRKAGADGKPTGEPFPLKALVIADQNSGVRINFLFTPEEFEAFGEKMRGDVIARPTVPTNHGKPMFLPHLKFTR